MPLILPKDLPAAKALQDENIFVMHHHRAATQDIRPLEILLVNLMPNKIVTETQLARVLANSPLQVRLTLLRTSTHTSKHTSAEHIGAFYTTLSEVKQRYYDGMIITGAPVEHIAYEEVDYWPELRELFDYARTNVYSTIHLCWAALSGLYYYYGIPKIMLPQKLHGVFKHKVLRAENPLVRGFDEEFWAPHSRSATVSKKDVGAVSALRVLAEGEEAGLHILSTENGREIYVMGHMEYDKDTLWQEYTRDTEAGKKPPLPQHYFHASTPESGIDFRWRAHGQLFFSNWLNYYVYQATPFELDKLGNI